MMKRSLVTLMMCGVLLGTGRISAITVGPFGPHGEGGDQNGQTFLIGTGGQVHELDSFLYLQGLDLNGNLLGTTAQISRDSLPANLDFQFSFTLSPDTNDITLNYSFTNASTTTFNDARFFVLLDAEIDETINTLFNEYGTVQGNPGPGGGNPEPYQWQIDEPGFQSGTLTRNLYLGTLNNTNSILPTSLNDVAMALGFSLGTLRPGDGASVRVMISQSQHVLGNFSLTQHDADPSSTTVITFSGLQGQATSAELTGTVFQDANGNGAADPGEALSGVGLLLLSNQVTVAQTTTDNSGRYGFTNAPGNYSLQLDLSSLPAGLVLVPVTSGATTNPWSTTLTAGSVTTVNWGLAPPPQGAVGGTVFRDNNGNGVADAGEWLTGVRLLLRSNQVVVAQTTTITGGRYSFTNAPGNYSLEVDATTLPPGLLLVPVPSGATNNPWVFPLIANVFDTVNWGFAPPPVGAVIGTVFRDANTNGIPDAGEALSGVHLFLRSNQVTVAQTTTDTNGRYNFTNVPGSYTLQVDTTSLPAGFLLVPVQLGATNNPWGLILTANAVNTVNWGFAPPPVGAVTGTVFRDNNTDGIADAGEGLGGVRLFLQSNQVTVAQTTTDSGGRYTITNAPGNFTLQLDTSSLPAGLVLIPVQLGATNNPWGLGLTANGVTLVNWGFVPPPVGAVIGTVFRDNNTNGVADAGEALGGARLLLQSNQVTVAQTTTDSIGRYDFTNAPGNYTLQVDASSVPAGLVLVPVVLGATSNPWSLGLTPNVVTTVNWGFRAPGASQFENVDPLVGVGLSWQLNRARGTLVGTLSLTNLAGSGTTLGPPWRLGMQPSANFFYPTNFGATVSTLSDGVPSIDLSSAMTTQLGQGLLPPGQFVVLTNTVEIYSLTRSAPSNAQFEIWAARQPGVLGRRSVLNAFRNQSVVHESKQK